MHQDLKDKIKNSPQAPGCYIFYDKRGFILYVGKAKNLRNRVRSYFTKAAAEDQRTEELVTRIHDVKFEITESELDALFEEYKLIKQHKPWHNSQMKADKKRPYLKISDDSPYPSLTISEEKEQNDCIFYDFFTDDRDIDDKLDLICKVWGLPKCKRTFGKTSAVCMYREIDECLAPCSGNADSDEYCQAIDDLKSFFDGGNSKIVSQIEIKMQDASKDLNFEKAAYYKDLLTSANLLQKKAKKRYHLPEKGKALALIRPHSEKTFSAFYIEDGVVIFRSNFVENPDDEAVSAFVELVESRKYKIYEHEWMAACLTEVIADKQIILLTENKKAYEIAKSLAAF